MHAGKKICRRRIHFFKALQPMTNLLGAWDGCIGVQENQQLNPRPTWYTQEKESHIPLLHTFYFEVI